MEWPREKNLELIEEYRKRSILWNTFSEEHRDSISRCTARQELALMFDIDVETLKRKIRCLRSAFLREYKKMLRRKAGLGPGSCWYGFEPLMFLESVIVKKYDPKAGFADLDVTYEDPEYNEELENPLSPFESSENSDIKQKRKLENKHEDQFEEHFTILEPKVSNGHILYEVPGHEIRKNEPSTNTGVKKKKGNTNQNNCSTPPRNSNIDDHSVYGQHVSNELRILDARSQTVAKHLINNILFEAAMGKFSDAGLNSQFNLSESLSYPKSSTFQFCDS